MELESLKQIWNTLEPSPEPEQKRETMLALLQKRSNGPVARMRRNLVIELFVIVIAYIPLIIFYLVEFNGRLSTLSGMVFIIGVFFCGYYYRKLQLLRQMQCVSCMVRSNLARQVSTLKRYTRFYLLVSTLIIPITAWLTYVIIRWKLPHSTGLGLYRQLSGPSPWWTSPIFWQLIILPLTIPVYYFNAWYINKLYGRHIKKLQELLREMDEE